MHAVPNKSSSEQVCFLFLLLLLGADCLFLAIHLAWLISPGVTLELYSLSQDHGYAEFYQYIKYVWAAAIVGLTGMWLRSLTGVSWGLLFSYLLMDDAWWIHERAGDWLHTTLHLPRIGAMEGDALGEALYAFAVIGILLVPIVIGWFVDNRYWRGMTRYLAAALLTLGLFAVVLDSMDEIFPILDGPVISMIEDFGEMCLMSVMLWIAIRYAAGSPIAAADAAPSG